MKSHSYIYLVYTYPKNHSCKTLQILPSDLAKQNRTRKEACTLPHHRSYGCSGTQKPATGSEHALYVSHVGRFDLELQIGAGRLIAFSSRQETGAARCESG